MKKFLKGFFYALRGLNFSFRERNMRVHGFAALLVLCIGLLFPLTAFEWVELLFAIGLVMSAETFNTAIEQIVNLIRDDCKVPYANEKLGKTKDLAAGAVLIAAIAAGLIGIRIFLPYFLDLV